LGLAAKIGANNEGAPMPVKLLLNWWNLIYIVPFGVALLYLLVYAATGIGGEHGGDIGADADADADVDADADADVDADADGDLHAEVDADADADADTDTEGEGAGHADSDAPLHAEAASIDGGAGGSPLVAALGFIGVGKAPLSVLVLMLLISWSVIGFVTNQLVYAVWPAEWLPPLLSLPLAFFGSLLATSGLARLLGRWMPSTETYVHAKDQLVGRKGQAIYAIDEKFGLVSVRNVEGDLFQVPGRTAAGAAKIEAGAEVVLFDYDAERGLFSVAPFDEKRVRSRPRRAASLPRDPGLPRDRAPEAPPQLPEGPPQVKQ
jgi:hypothetical protein